MQFNLNWGKESTRILRLISSFLRLNLFNRITSTESSNLLTRQHLERKECQQSWNKKVQTEDNRFENAKIQHTTDVYFIPWILSFKENINEILGFCILTLSRLGRVKAALRILYVVPGLRARAKARLQP